jgi:hypothetical protein
MDDFMFMLFVLDEEAKEALIEALAQEEDPTDLDTRYRVAERLGYNVDHFSDYTWEYIIEEAEKRKPWSF